MTAALVAVLALAFLAVVAVFAGCYLAERWATDPGQDETSPRGQR